MKTFIGLMWIFVIALILGACDEGNSNGSDTYTDDTVVIVPDATQDMYEDTCREKRAYSGAECPEPDTTDTVDPPDTGVDPCEGYYEMVGPTWQCCNDGDCNNAEECSVQAQDDTCYVTCDRLTYGDPYSVDDAGLALDTTGLPTTFGSGVYTCTQTP